MDGSALFFNPSFFGQEQGSLPCESLKCGLFEVGQPAKVLNKPFKGHLPYGSSLKGAASSFLRRDHPVPADRSGTVTEEIQYFYALLDTGYPKMLEKSNT
jgi:hypothetical protein